MIVFSRSLIGLAALVSLVTACSFVIVPPFAFVPGQCTVDLLTPRTVECGFLEVAEVRGVPQTRTIQIAVAILRAPAASLEPVLFVMGGPEYPGFDQFSVDYFAGAPYMDSRDLILVDIRGVGTSDPFLGCPEIDEAFITYFLDDGPTVEQLNAAHQACRDRLVGEGVELRSYDVLNAASDLADLRFALGIERWVVVGLSAGGPTTLELMRVDPAGIRAVVLDSPLTRVMDLPFDFWLQGAILVDKVLALCASQTSCEEAYPDLGSRFTELVEALNSDPLVVETPVDGSDPLVWTLDGPALVAEAVYMALHPSSAAFLPATLDLLASEGGLLEYFEETMVLYPPEPINDFIAEGRTAIKECRDDWPFTTANEITAAIEAAPLIEGLVLDNVAYFEAVCSAWDVGQSNPLRRSNVSSSIPTLVLMGEFDGLVPSWKAVEQADALAYGYAFTCPNRGHVQLFDFDGADLSCPLSITAEFLAAPLSQPDGACIEEMEQFEVWVSSDFDELASSLRGAISSQGRAFTGQGDSRLLAWPVK